MCNLAKDTEVYDLQVGRRTPRKSSTSELDSLFLCSHEGTFAIVDNVWNKFYALED